MRPALCCGVNPFSEPQFITKQIERAEASVRGKVQHLIR